MDIKEIMKAEHRKYQRLFILLSLILGGVLIVSISMGRAPVPIAETSRIIIGKLFSMEQLLKGIDDYRIAIVWDVRMPRILIGGLVGAGLAVSGSIFQAILRNPLADPYTIGVSTGAAFGAVLTIYLNIFIVAFTIPLIPVAFLFALLTLMVIIKIASNETVLESTHLILAGIIVSAILSSGISLIKSMAGEEVSAIVFWLLGSLAAKSWQQLLVSLPLILICITIASHFADDLDILSLGRQEAKNIGVNADKMVKLYLILAALLTAVCVSICGIIGFVGLVVPHLLRMGVATKHRYLIPLSAITGAIMLALADNLSRLLFTIEIPVGVITTLIGGPFFIYIFMKRKVKGGG